MGTLFVYAIKSGICLTVFYLFYKFLLSNETFHKLNRAALLGILILSLTLPAFNFNFSMAVSEQNFEIPMEFILLAQSNIALPQPEAAGVTFMHFLLLAYIVGIVFFAVRNIFSIIKICILIRTGKKQRIENNITIVLTANNISPFSWFRYIVICEKDFAENGEAIVEHEKAHIAKRHSLDLLLCEIYDIVQWFNPAAWLFKRELQNIHEYQADETVINKGIDTKQYKLLLIQKAVGERLFVMANNFNKNKLSKRIKMMSKQKSNPYSRLKYLYVLPLLALVVTVFANPQVQNEMNRISAVSINDFAPASDADTENDYLAENSTTTVVDTAIVIRGNDTINVTIINENSKPQTLYIIDGEIVDNIDSAYSYITVTVRDSITEHDKNENNIIVVTINQDDDSKKSAYTPKKFPTNKKTVIVNTDTISDTEYFSLPLIGNYSKFTINGNSYSVKYQENLNLDSIQKQINAQMLKIGSTKHQLNVDRKSLDSIQKQINAKMLKINSNTRQLNEDRKKLDLIQKQINIKLNSGVHQLNGEVINFDSLITKVIMPKHNRIIDSMKHNGFLNLKVNKKGNECSYSIDTLAISNFGSFNLDATPLIINATPLVILDDEEIKFEDLENIKSEKILSVSVLKQEVAKKHYGQRGINGVIVIETKNEE